VPLDGVCGIHVEGFGVSRVERLTVVGIAVQQKHARLTSVVRLKHIAGPAKKALYFEGCFASLFRWSPVLSRPAKSPLDAFDHKILAILQRDNTTPQRTIGEAVGLSAPAVQRRIKRMTEDGVIRANVAVLDSAALGQSITIFVEVEVISETAKQIEQAKSQFAAAPEIQQCYYVTGEADFILVIVVPSMADYEALTRRLFFSNNNVKRFRTFVAMDRVKVGLSVPIER
jgi:DNA-binding Lrp family transcriptional regulator